jgi:hypothetical protein
MIAGGPGGLRSLAAAAAPMSTPFHGANDLRQAPIVMQRDFVKGKEELL